MLSSKFDFLKDIDRIKSLSSKIDKKITELKPSDEKLVEKLSIEELQDLKKIVGIADFLICKYEDKKEMSEILKHFAGVVSDAAGSITNLDDEISELILSAEDSINKIKDTHIDITKKSDFKPEFDNGPEYNEYETSPINLTNFVTHVNSQGYHENSQENSEQGN